MSEANYSLTTKKSWNETLRDLEETMRKWNVGVWDVSYPKGARSISYAEQPVDERKVLLKYTRNNREIVLTMDRQGRAVDNLRVLYLAVEAMRMNEARGIADVLQDAYAQLQAPTTQRDPYEVLGVRTDAPLAVVEAAYRARVKDVHPDIGGPEGAVKELTAAIEQIRRERK